jgi:hypothetical protein
MKNRKKSIERRKHNRFRVKEGGFAMFMSAPANLGQIEDMSMGEIALAVLKAKPLKMGQIVNISKGGLAFSYIDSEIEAGKSSELDIVFAQNGFHLKQVSFKTVADYKAISEFPFSSIVMRQRSVQFREMRPSQTSRLDYFIKNYTSK